MLLPKNKESLAQIKITDLNICTDCFSNRVALIMNKKISDVTRYLITKASLNSATDIVGKLSKSQRFELLEELEILNITSQSGRYWMVNHIKDILKDEVRELRISKTIKYNISEIAKSLFFFEGLQGAKIIISSLTDKDKIKLLEELRNFDVKKYPGRQYMFDYISELCTN